MSKLIQNYSGFALLRFVIGPENLRIVIMIISIMMIIIIIIKIIIMRYSSGHSTR